MIDFDWDPVRRRVQGAAGAQAGWTFFIDAVEEEVADAFLTAHDAAGSFRGRSQGQKSVWQVRQVSTWQSRNAVLAQKVTHSQAHSHCSTAT